MSGRRRRGAGESRLGSIVCLCLEFKPPANNASRHLGFHQRTLTQFSLDKRVAYILSVPFDNPTMIIPITFNSSTKWPKLPPALAKISHDEVVLIELQGSLEVELNHPSERNGQLVGNLTIDEAAVSSTRTSLPDCHPDPLPIRLSPPFVLLD